MSRKVLLCGEPDGLRKRLAAEMDAGFDVVVDEVEDVLTATRRLPAGGWDLFVVLAGGGRVPGLDLVRLLEAHALHERVPVLFVGDDEEQRKAAAAAGAELTLPGSADSRALASALTQLLDLD